MSHLKSPIVYFHLSLPDIRLIEKLCNRTEKTVIVKAGTVENVTKAVATKTTMKAVAPIKGKVKIYKNGTLIKIVNVSKAGLFKVTYTDQQKGTQLKIVMVDLVENKSKGITVKVK